KGMASHVLGQGGDGLYLFNFYFENNAQEDLSKSLNASGLVSRKRSQRLLTELGSLSKRNKIYCASDGVTNSYGVLQVADLPLACGNGKESKVGIFVGDDVKADKPARQLLFLRTSKPARMDVKINGADLQPLAMELGEQYDRLHGLT